MYGQDVKRETGNWPTSGKWRHRARLLGGTADGRAVQLDSLIPEIAVYVTDGRTIACDRLLPHAGEGRFIGMYQLATGSGPEPPVYVVGV